MPIVDLYSKRQKKLHGEIHDVHIYDELPNPLRNKIVYSWMNLFDGIRYGTSYIQPDFPRQLSDISREVVETLCCEYGVFELPGTAIGQHRNLSPPEQVYFYTLCEFFIKVQDIEKALDVVELFFRIIYEHSNSREGNNSWKARVEDTIEELNARFQEHGIGYRFSDGKIIRIDSEFTHSEIVEPALRLLSQGLYSSAQKEFLKAHDHYRKGNHQEALNECLKAFESVMKIICDKRGWHYRENANASQLIETCFNNGLIPKFWKSHYESLQNLLKSGIPTARNNLSGHGQGADSRTVPDHLVAYALHMTASTIVFLVEAEENL